MTRWMTAACVVLIGGSMVLAADRPQREGGERERPGRKAPAGEGERPQGQGEGERPDPGQAIHRMLRELDLTEGQREQVREILTEHRAAAEKYRDEHKAEFDALRAKAQKAREAGDRQAMQAVHEEFKALMDKGPGGPAEALKKVKAILTEEQAAKLDKLAAQMRQRGDDRPGARGDGERPKRPDGEGKRGEGERPKRGA